MRVTDPYPFGNFIQSPPCPRVGAFFFARKQNPSAVYRGILLRCGALRQELPLILFSGLFVGRQSTFGLVRHQQKRVRKSRDDHFPIFRRQRQEIFDERSAFLVQRIFPRQLFDNRFAPTNIHFAFARFKPVRVDVEGATAGVKISFSHIAAQFYVCDLPLRHFDCLPESRLTYS